MEKGTPKVVAPDLHRASSAPAVIIHSWRRFGIAIETTTEELIDASAATPTRLRLQRANSLVIDRCTRSHRVHTEITVHPAFVLNMTLLLLLVGSANGLNISGALRMNNRAPATGTDRRAAVHAQALSQPPVPEQPPPVQQLLEHGAGLLERAFQRGGEELVKACAQPVLAGVAGAAGGLPTGVQRLVLSDVDRLHASLRTVICGDDGEGCLLDGRHTPLDVLAEYARSRAPIALWGAARCLERAADSSFAFTAPLRASVTASLNAPEHLGEALAPLTREAMPLLAACLVASPWHLCRLSFSYLAYLLASFGRSGRQRLLRRLLDDVADALEAGRARGARPPPAEARDGRDGDEADCARVALGTLGGWVRAGRQVLAAAPPGTGELLTNCVRHAGFVHV